MMLNYKSGRIPRAEAICSLDVPPRTIREYCNYCILVLAELRVYTRLAPFSAEIYCSQVRGFSLDSPNRDSAKYFVLK